MVHTGRIAPDNLDVFMPLIPDILITQHVREGDMHFYGISEDGEAVGVVVIKEAADTAELKYMYLLPAKRRRGIMDKALSDIMFELKDEGYTRLTMDYIPSEYPAIAHICERFAFTHHKTDKAYFKFTVDRIRKCKAITYNPQGTLKLRALPESIRQELYRQIKNKGYDISHILDDKTLKASVEEHSLVYMEADKPMGLMLVQDMKSLAASERTTAFGRIFPEGSSADIALIYIGSTQVKAPLYLISALCRDILAGYEENDIITGYFPDGHVTKLLEGTLEIKGLREVTSEIMLDSLEKYYE